MRYWYLGAALLCAVGGTLRGAEVANGSFENGLKGWTQEWRSTQSAEDLFLIDNSQKVDGDKSLQVRASNNSFLTGQNVKLKPSTSYRIRFQFLTEKYVAGVEAVFGLYLFDKRGGLLGDFGTKPLAGTANIWVEHQVDFTTPDNVGHALVEFFFKPNARYWVDSVTIEELQGVTLDPFQAMYPDNSPLFGELLENGGTPGESCILPYWGYNGEKDNYERVAGALAVPYNIEAEVKSLSEHHMAPFLHGWHQHFPDLAKQYRLPALYYPNVYALDASDQFGALKTAGGKANLNDPGFRAAFLAGIDQETFASAAPDAPKWAFLADEPYNVMSYVVPVDQRTDEYWKNMDALVREKYGFGKYGIPDSDDDTNPFKRIAYLRHQSDLAVETLEIISKRLRDKFPGITILGYDEWAELTPLDWSRMGAHVDFQPSQTLTNGIGIRGGNPAYITKFYGDLTGRKVIPFLHYVRYPSAPAHRLVGEWLDQIYLTGGGGIFVGCVEWYNRYLNHPMFADPLKYQLLMKMLETTQRMGELKQPEQSTLALHFGSYTIMAKMRETSHNIAGNFTMLGMGCRAWPKFVDDFQVDRDITTWDPFKVVVLSDTRYVSDGFLAAVDRLLERGGTLLVMEPAPFIAKIDGTDLTDYRTKLLGVTIGDSTPASPVTDVATGKVLNPALEVKRTVSIVDPENVQVLASFADGTPAILDHRVKNGRVRYCAFQPSTNTSVEDVQWVGFWRRALADLNIPIDVPIWRFSIPRPEMDEPFEFSHRCLSGNGLYYYRNNADVSMNEPADAVTYSYSIAPATIPDVAPKSDGKISAKKGKLTNRRQTIALKTDGYGNLLDKSDLDVEKWAVEYSASQTDPIDITFDLGKECEIGAVRLFFCGALPVSQLSWSDNGTDFKPFGAEIAARNAEPYGGISELRVTGNAHGRYVSLHIGGNRTEALRLFEIDVWSPELVPEQ